MGRIHDVVGPLLGHEVLWYKVWHGWLLESPGA